jgi:hypothetical protein
MEGEMRNRIAAFAGRAAVPAVLLAALLVAPVALPRAARGQEEGDKVVITLKSGKKFNVVLVSRTPTEVKMRMGENEITLPVSTIATIERVGGEAPAAPAEESAPATAPAPSAGTKPKPATITMKDGTVLTGFIVARGGGRVWFVEGEPRALATDFVAKIEGGEPGAGSGQSATITGSSSDRAQALVQEFASGDTARELAAYSALEALGPEAIAAPILAGLKNENAKVRRMCMSLAGRVRQVGALPTIFSILHTDTDPEVRKAAAETLGSWPAEGAPEALLRAAGWDRVPDVRTAALTSLTRYAAPEMAKSLVDMLAEFPDDATALPALYAAIRRATGKELWTTRDRAGWMKWWDQEGGKEEIEKVIAARRRAAAGETEDESEGE